MADIFTNEDARQLLQNKVVLLLGDSNVRTIYKDLIILIVRNEIQNLKMLKFKGGESFEGLDRRTCFNGLVKGRDYKEGREFCDSNIFIEYHFIARCYTPEIEELLNQIKKGEKKAPDVLIMNSCLWDINRWGPNGVDAYKDNMQKLMQLFKACLPEKTLVIWTTALPISTEIRGGLLLKQLDFMQSLLRFDVMEANLFCRDLVVKHGYDVLDLHYHLHNQIHRRCDDGIHYGPLPTRFITNLILTHISLSWNVALPGNFSGVALRRVKTECVRQIGCKDVQLPVVPASLRNEKNAGAKKPPRTPETPKRKRGGGKFRTQRSILGRGGPVDRKLQSLRGHVWGGHHPPWQNGQQSAWPGEAPPAAWQNNQRAPPPWYRENDSQKAWRGSYEQQSGWQNDEVWSSTPLPKAPQHPRYSPHAPPKPAPALANDMWDDPQQKYTRSEYADFERVGPVRRNNKFPTSRHRPY